MASVCACAHVPDAQSSTTVVLRAVRFFQPEQPGILKMGRLKNHSDFVAVLKCRRKVSDRDVVLHFLVRGQTSAADRGFPPVRRLGLAVSKAVGGAVIRNRIKRRFRVIASRHEGKLPEDCDIVLRAKPAAAKATFRSLDGQIASLFMAAGRSVNDSAPRRANGQISRATAENNMASHDAKFGAMADTHRRIPTHQAGEA